jgi:hypothetical protein
VDGSRDFVYKVQLNLNQRPPTSKGLTGFQLYLGQPDSGDCVHDRGLRRFREMPRGVENSTLSVTDPASLDVSISQDGKSIRKLYRPLREFHRLFKISALDIKLCLFAIGILGGDFLFEETVHTTR